MQLVGAIKLQPLTSEQVDHYIDSLPETTKSQLGAALDVDPTLHELSKSPLMLSVMTLAAGELGSSK
ncbi:MAG: hypothetical protein IPK16_25885 [Anaerolineales bacterium]|nr:hypothetical protein [Anaerolineales bacterium]